MPSLDSLLPVRWQLAQGTSWRLAGPVAIAAALFVPALPADGAQPSAARGPGAVAGQPAPRPLGNLVPMGSGNLRFRWTRSGVTVDLRDREGRWTEAEAIQVRDALDLLPDAYIRKAIDGGMRQVYRDGRLPSSPVQLFDPPSPTLNGVAVPEWPWNYVAVGDNLFNGGQAKVNKVVTHELAHCIQYLLSGYSTALTGTPRFTSISWTSGIPFGTGLRSWNGFVTEYARTNHMEDFAESAAYYWVANDELQRASAGKFAYMRDVVFEGQVPPPQARDPWRSAVAPVVPEISGLGDSSDSWFSLVQVRGDYLMGPLDGGYNTIRYRGEQAVSLPITRSLIYSWVPAISAGSAPVTITTQDGTGRLPAAFNVEEPWWRFW